MICLPFVPILYHFDYLCDFFSMGCEECEPIRFKNQSFLLCLSKLKNMACKQLQFKQSRERGGKRGRNVCEREQERWQSPSFITFVCICVFIQIEENNCGQIERNNIIKWHERWMCCALCRWKVTSINIYHSTCLSVLSVILFNFLIYVRHIHFLLLFLRSAFPSSILYLILRLGIPSCLFFSFPRFSFPLSLSISPSLMNIEVIRTLHLSYGAEKKK